MGYSPREEPFLPLHMARTLSVSRMREKKRHVNASNNSYRMVAARHYSITRGTETLTAPNASTSLRLRLRKSAGILSK